MSRTAALTCAALLAIVGTAQAADSPRPSSGRAGKKPNILVIWEDDIGYSNISAYNLGGVRYHMPNKPGRP